MWGGSLTASGLWKDSTWCGHFLFPNLCHSTGRAGLTTPLRPAVPAPASPPLHQHQHQHPHFPAPAPHVCRRCTFLCLRKSGASRFGQMHAGPVSARRLPGQEWRKLRTETKACGLPPPTRREHIQQQDTPPRPRPWDAPASRSVPLWVSFSLQAEPGPGAGAGRWGASPCSSDSPAVRWPPPSSGAVAPSSPTPDVRGPCPSSELGFVLGPGSVYEPHDRSWQPRRLDSRTPNTSQVLTPGTSFANKVTADVLSGDEAALQWAGPYPKKDR